MEDPSETMEVSAEQADKVNELESKMDQLVNETGESVPLVNPEYVEDLNWIRSNYTSRITAAIWSVSPFRQDTFTNRW